MMNEQNNQKNGVSSYGGADGSRKVTASVQNVRNANAARPAANRPAVSGVRTAKNRSTGRPHPAGTKARRGISRKADILQIIGKPFSMLNRKLDVFRKNETSAIITNTVLGGIVVAVILGIFFLMKPGIDSMRAGLLASGGKADRAISIVNELQRRDYSEEKLNKTRISVAEGLIKSGNQEWASSVISEIPDGDIKTELEKKQSYARAEALCDAADYTGAAQIFYQLGDYGDAQARYEEIRCILAILAWQAGNEDSARSLLMGVSDLVKHVSSAAVTVMGDEDSARSILESEFFSAEKLSEMEHTMASLSAARKEMPEGRIAAGWNHTVVLKNDGTVLAVGDDSQNQLRVEGWTGITRVAAGAYHTLGLRSDGTVVATGNNAVGQCDVSGWTDIVAIAAGTADTIGLKSDGSVVAAGKNSGKVSGWRGATFVTAGSYSMGCIVDNGSMLSSHKGAQMDMGVSLHDLSVCGPVSVGVLYDGSMVSSFEGAPKWENIVSATACESGILAIDVDGKVLVHFYNEGSKVDISVPGKAVEVESGGTHHVVLTEDGSVYAFGNNDYGQCNIG